MSMLPTLASIARRVSTVFSFNDTATTELYTLSLHDALPIYHLPARQHHPARAPHRSARQQQRRRAVVRSEEHTSELQSRRDLVCRLLLEKKNYRRSDRSPVASRPSGTQSPWSAARSAPARSL